VGVTVNVSSGQAVFVRMTRPVVVSDSVSFPPRTANLSAVAAVTHIGSKALAGSQLESFSGFVRAIVAWRGDSDGGEGRKGPRTDGGGVAIAHTGAANAFAGSLGLGPFSPASAGPPPVALRALWLDSADPATLGSDFVHPPPAGVSFVSESPESPFRPATTFRGAQPTPAPAQLPMGVEAALKGGK